MSVFNQELPSRSKSASPILSSTSIEEKASAFRTEALLQDATGITNRPVQLTRAAYRDNLPIPTISKAVTCKPAFRPRNPAENAH